MNQLTSLINAFIKDEEGATAVEYGVLIALIIAACVVIIGTLGGQIKSAFTDVSNSLTTAGITS
ncbi:MAG: Flp family type IVb pilin [Desulfobulbaceae bacterium]|jgi:pilus assembly protein Flp/PilA|nr:Flp family type IVb pilin [Desulfobulbaceae bacterium]